MMKIIKLPIYVAIGLSCIDMVDRQKSGTKSILLLGVVAHGCIPSYLEGRDQEDCCWKPAWANSSGKPYLLKNPSQKKGWWSGSRCRP
jgi:hypothetical protein